ncbi:MAG TPA: hypothetical protein VNB22_20185 [Pyrinomonadaceae bacterium]|nr:hypothetical protein [Pyrinomonadaceae bacterium]
MNKLLWRFGLTAGLFLAIFTLYPQFKMWYLRGDDWQGHYAYNDIDEVAYASYVKALIDGRPRRNDPYTGRDDAPGDPQPESLFSIQFASPYAIAVPARIFRVGAPWSMTLAGAFAGFLAALAAFWVIGKITGDSLYAMMGSLLVLAGGALAAGEGAIGEIFDFSYSYPYFPAFRRYVPAMPFPFFLAMIALIWLLVNTQDLRKRIIYCVLAALCFSFTNFSYFYTWTTAVAWLGCLALMWLSARPEGFWKDFKAFIALGAGCLLSLGIYAVLLSNRSHTMDDVQLLVSTHAPDLLRVPIYISLVALLIIIIGVLLKKINFKDRETLFAVSLALVPLVVFNQQIITGRSLQPIHYQVFIGNYVAALALVVAVGILLKKSEIFNKTSVKAAITLVALLAVVWGFVECHYTVRVLDDANIERDKGFDVGRYLTEISKQNGDTHKTVIMPFSMLQGDDLPTIAPQSVLWARHQHVFAGVTWQENKERYYQYLHFQGVTPEELADSMKTKGDFVSVIALFGWGRHTDRLNSAYKPLTYGEIDEEAQIYGEYIKNFNPRSSPDTVLSYVVVPSDWQVDFANIDKFYQREQIAIFPAYTLYRVTLKN